MTCVESNGFRCAAVLQFHTCMQYGEHLNSPGECGFENTSTINVLYLLRLNPENAGHQVQLRRVLREREPYAFFLAPFGFLVVEVSRKSTWHLPVLWLTVARCETLWSFPHKIAIKEVDTFSDCLYFWLLITSVNLDHVTQSPNKATLKWTMLFVEVVKHLLCLLTGPTIPRTTATTLNCSLLRATAILTS